MSCLEFYISAKQGFPSPCSGPGADKDSRDISPQPYCLPLWFKATVTGAACTAPLWGQLSQFLPSSSCGSWVLTARPKELKWRAWSDERSRCKTGHFNQVGPFMGASCAQSRGSGSQAAVVQTWLYQLLALYPGASQFTPLCFSVIVCIMEP